MAINDYDYNWLDEASVIANQCWQDETTKGLEQDVRLTCVIARKIAAWMETAAFHARNEAYWRERALRAEGVATSISFNEQADD